MPLPLSLNPVLALGLLFLLLGSALLFRNRRPLPPGPPGIPFLGNILDLPKKESWKAYLEWGREYNSDILSMRVPGQQFFILNSAKVVQDLLVKRSNIYSDRPRSTLISDLIQAVWLIVFMNNNDRWKQHRHLFKREFDSATATPVNRSHALQASRRLLRRLLKSSDYEGELRLAAIDSILSLTYGITPTNFEHPFIVVTEKVNAIFADVARGGYLVDVFPIFRFLPKWFPGARQFHSMGDKGRALAKDVIMGPYEEIKAQIDNGTAVSSVASRFLSAVQDGDSAAKAELDTMHNVLANAYLAGSDTSICALFNLVLAMATHQDVQKKAQKELDGVLGGHRLPDFNDYERLPYITAIVNEVFRWHPVTPFAVYHLSTDDDTYNGFDIPKGSIIIPNAYALLHDESVFGPETEKFSPDRFMKADGPFNPDLGDVDVAFGFGRRACPGRFIARDTIWIMTAAILSAYDVSEAVDLEGKTLTPDSHLEFTNAMISFAPHVKVSLQPRLPENMIYEGVIEG